MRRVESGAGFTLLELIVGLTIGGLVLAVAVGLVETVIDGTATLTEGDERHVRHVNAERVLHELFARADTRDGAEPFAGEPRQVRFSTWCDTPGGWLERCRVELSLEVRDGTWALSLRHAGYAIVLDSGFVSGAFGFLHTAERGGVWLGRWGPGPTLPPAVGLERNGALTIYPLGDRG